MTYDTFIFALVMYIVYLPSYCLLVVYFDNVFGTHMWCNLAGHMYPGSIRQLGGYQPRAKVEKCTRCGQIR